MSSDSAHVNVPVEQCMEDASRVIERHPGSLVWQKWDCAHCGSRQTMETPNTFYDSGRCESCGEVSPITHCNFLLALATTPDSAAVIGAVLNPQQKDN